MDRLFGGSVWMDCDKLLRASADIQGGMRRGMIKR